MLKSTCFRSCLLWAIAILALGSSAFADQLTLTIADVTVPVNGTATVTINYSYTLEGASTGFGGAGFTIAYDNTVATIDPGTFAVGTDEFSNVDTDAAATGMAANGATKFDIYVNPNFNTALLAASKDGVFGTFEIQITNGNANPDTDDFTLVASDGYAFDAGGNFIAPTLVDGQVDIVKLFNAADTTLTTDEDTAAQKLLTGLFTDKDNNGVDGTVTGVTQPAHGTVTLDAGTVTYTPALDYNGSDTFTYTAENEDGSDTGTVNVTVNAVNDAPVNTVVPFITGTFKYNEQLQAAAGTWNDDKDYPEGGSEIVYSYEWWTSTEANGTRTAAVIAGQTNATLTIPAGVAGKYLAVKVTAHDNGDPGSATAEAWSAWTLVEKATAAVSVIDPTPVYSGTAQQATATTDPADLTLVFTYDGETTAPTDAGTYAVVATIDDPNYQGTDTGTLTIGKAPLTIKANDASRSYFALNGTIDYGATFTLTGNKSREGLLGDDTTDQFYEQELLAFDTDASDGTEATPRSPWDGTYKTLVSFAKDTDGTVAANYQVTFADGVLTIDKGSAPYANGANSQENPLVLVTGRTTTFNLNSFFDDDDKPFGDALVFANIHNYNGPVEMSLTLDGNRASGDVLFDPGTISAGDPITFYFDVDVQDSANPPLLLPAGDFTVDGTGRLYVKVINNQPPDLDWTGSSEATVNEGTTVRVQVQAVETPDHIPQPDDIASITITSSGVDITNQATVEIDGTSGTLVYTVPTDQNTSSILGDTIHTFTVTATDAAGSQASETRTFTVANVNVPPTLDDIADQTVDEDAEDLSVVLTGVSNGGENNDPAIVAVNDVRGGVTASITAQILEGASLFASYRLEQIAFTGTRETGDEQNFRFDYVLAQDANGTATVQITVNDGSGSTEEGTEATIVKTFTITVNPVNDAPVNTDAPSIDGVGHVGRTLTANVGAWNDDKDLDWAEVVPRDEWITYTYQWQQGSLVPTRPALAWEDIAGADGPTFVPTIEQNGKSVRVVVTATDSGTPEPALSATALSEGKLIDNAAPSFDDGETASRWGFEDDDRTYAVNRLLPAYGFTFPLAATDDDEDDLTWTIVADPANGTASVVDGVVTYTPAADYYNSGTIPAVPGRNGVDSFTVQIADGLGGSDQIVVNMTVVSVNDAPVVDAVTLEAQDNTGTPVSFGQPGDIAKIIVGTDVSDVDDGTFTYSYAWQVLRDGQTTGIDTGDVPQLTTADLDNAGLAATFLKDDKVTVLVTVTDDGGGQDHNTPANKQAQGTRTASLGSPGWYPQVVVPGIGVSRQIVSFAKVRIEDAEGTTVLAAILAEDAPIVYEARQTDEDLSLRPEDYMTGDGDGADGLLPGVHTPYFSYWNTETGDFSEEVQGDDFTVSYDEPEAPTAVDSRDCATPAACVQAGGAAFSFRLPMAQGYVLEIFDEAGHLVQRIVRPLARPDAESAFPVTFNVVDLFVGLALGDYTWRVRAYNPLVPADLPDATRTVAWFVDNTGFTVTEEAPAGVPAAPALFSPGDGVAFNPSPSTKRALLDFYWSAVPGATNYYVYVGLEEGVAVVNNEITTDTALTDVALGPGTYNWAVRARNASGKSPWSAVGSFVVNTGPGPGLVTGNYDDTTDPTISFESFGLAPTGVDLYILDAGSYRSWLLADRDPNESIVLTGDLALAGHTYWYKTRSVTDNGDRGAWSTWSVYTIDPPLDEVVVSVASLDTTTPGEVTIRWIWRNMPDGAQVQVRIMRVADYSFFMVTDPTGAADSPLVLTDANVTAAGSYYFQIRPLDAAGEPLNDWSDWSQYTVQQQQQQ